ncbi:hypothetical protein SAMN02745866_01765 [Alteromonadaceae bacterium Bs31]|nr:hypothetical protein SAMN02745866_01765 [Alteromonadaceae bacterium Bs31]
MADFVSRKTVTTRKPQVRVDPGLPPGVYLMEVQPVTVGGKELLPAYMRIEMSENEIRFSPVELKPDDDKDLEDQLLELLALPARLIVDLVGTISRRIREISGRDDD